MYRKGVTVIEIIFILLTIIMLVSLGLMLLDIGNKDDMGSKNSILQNNLNITNRNLDIMQYNNIILDKISQLDLNNSHHDISIYSMDVLNKSGLLKISANSSIHLINSKPISKNHLQLIYEININKEDYSGLRDASYFYDDIYQGYHIKLMSLRYGSPSYLTYEISDR